jgi:phage anti-repressor protein
LYKKEKFCCWSLRDSSIWCNGFLTVTRFLFFISKGHKNMIKQLIKIGQQEELGNDVNTVNARDLHEYLEVGKDFSTWIKNRIEEFKFQENQDFIVFHNSGENLSGGRPKIEYHITLDMAKHLSMVERNDQGFKARQYFIRCEKQLKEVQTKLIAKMAKDALKTQEQMERINRDISEMRKQIADRPKQSNKKKEYMMYLDKDDKPPVTLDRIGKLLGHEDYSDTCAEMLLARHGLTKANAAMTYYKATKKAKDLGIALDDKLWFETPTMHFFQLVRECKHHLLFKLKE